MTLPQVFTNSFCFVLSWSLYPYERYDHAILQDDTRIEKKEEGNVTVTKNQDDRNPKEIKATSDLPTQHGEQVRAILREVNPYRLPVPCHFFLKEGTVPASYSEHICYASDSVLPRLLAMAYRKNKMADFYLQNKPFILTHHDLKGLKSLSLTDSKKDRVVRQILTELHERNPESYETIKGVEAQERFFDVIQAPPLDNLDLLKQYVQKEWKRNYVAYWSDHSNVELTKSDWIRIKTHFLADKIEKFKEMLNAESQDTTSFQYERELLTINLKDLIDYLQEEKARINDEKQQSTMPKDHSHEETQLETNSQQLRKELERYGFFHYLDDQGYSEKAREKVFQLLATNALPYRIALLRELGYIEYIRNEYCKTNREREQLLAKMNRAPLRKVRGNINVLNTLTSDDKRTYTSPQHVEQVQKDLKKACQK